MNNYNQEEDNRELVCSIRVQIDGDHYEFLNILEGDDINYVVRSFSQKFNLTNSSTSELLK